MKNIRFQGAIYIYKEKHFHILTVIRRKEMFYLKMRSTHFIYGYMASGIW